MEKNFITTLLLFLCIVNIQQAQEMFDLRFVMDSYDCENDKAFINVEIKASNVGTEFRLGDQNYRLEFDASQLANPAIDSELDVSGNISNTGPQGFTIYSAHTLTGSTGNLISLNVVYVGGDGLLITSGAWVGVTRLEFDILNNSNCFNVEYNDYNNFPPTFVGGVEDGGGLYTVDEGSYFNFDNECIDCALTVPIELISFSGRSSNCNNILEWKTMSEVNASHFEILELDNDGQRFNTIGSVNAKGNSNSVKKYSFIDTHIDKSLSYYKLKQVDINGDYALYDLISVKNDCMKNVPHMDVRTYPNPVGSNGVLHLELGSLNSKATELRIQNMYGQSLIHKKLTLSLEQTKIELQTQQLLSGQYIIQVYDATGNVLHSSRLIKAE